MTHDSWLLTEYKKVTVPCQQRRELFNIYNPLPAAWGALSWVVASTMSSRRTSTWPCSCRHRRRSGRQRSWRAGAASGARPTALRRPWCRHSRCCRGWLTESQLFRSVILDFTLRGTPSANLGGLEGRLEVGQCRYSLTQLSKVQDGKECRRFRSVILAFTLRTTSSANLGGLEGRLEVGQCRYSLTLISKVQDGKE